MGDPNRKMKQTFMYWVVVERNNYILGCVNFMWSSFIVNTRFTGTKEGQGKKKQRKKMRRESRTFYLGQ